MVWTLYNNMGYTNFVSKSAPLDAKNLWDPQRVQVMVVGLQVSTCTQLTYQLHIKQQLNVTLVIRPGLYMLCIAAMWKWKKNQSTVYPMLYNEQ